MQLDSELIVSMMALQNKSSLHESGDVTGPLLYDTHTFNYVMELVSHSIDIILHLLFCDLDLLCTH